MSDGVDENTKQMLDHMRETILADRTELKMRVRELEAAQDAWRYSYEQQHVSLQKCLEENARLALLLGAKSTEVDRIWIEENERLERLLAEERALGDELAEALKGHCGMHDACPGLKRWRALRQQAES